MAACQDEHIVNLLLVLMVLAIWFLMNPRGLFTPPPPLSGGVRDAADGGPAGLEAHL